MAKPEHSLNVTTGDGPREDEEIATSFPPQGDAQMVRHAASSLDEKEHPNDNAQSGVQQVEAITLTWSKSHLIIAYAW